MASVPGMTYVLVQPRVIEGMGGYILRVSETDWNFRYGFKIHPIKEALDKI